ncbi:RNA-guided endonuclease TnpB family protein [uncultured Methanobrevibacter sp.]|uniref:RNA-guided endonuclease InsQ/TnpB family protein n=1 Tax=uncultured Methanobrevibacter sp. TaxID=253161 RepID=UPI0026350071|nr:RNA-guided endonuclease TnpB family protein [uncultured Methanobrevibacter sp.]
MKVVNKQFRVRIYPSRADRNDKGEKIVSINKIESNIGIYRFIYNKELEFINYFRSLLIQNGYDDNVIVDDVSCNVLLKMLREDYLFLEKAESSSRQQSQRNLIQSFKRHEDPKLNSGYPQFKRKNHTKQNFKIINNNNNVRIQKDKYGFDKIKLAKLGLVKFKTSKEYHRILRQASDKNDPSAKIKHVTIKKEGDEYYAVFNIRCMHVPERIIGPRQQVGIDIGCGKLAVLSNTQEILNLDLTQETDKIIQYQRDMNHHNKGSIRYNEAKRLFQVWFTKLLNKRNDYYDKMTTDIVKNSCFVAVQNENIIAWKNNKYLSHSIQLNAPRIFMDKIEYKCDWNDVEFQKVPRNFPSTQICSNCGKRNKNISGLDKLGIREWDCPECNEHHDRDVNASINILNKGLELVGTTGQ